MLYRLIRALVVLVALVSYPAFADIVLSPGQSQTIVCDDQGGGGGGQSTLACIEALSNWCYSNTSHSRDACYNLATSYCPSTRYSDCVSETAIYCYSHTSMNRDQCFESAQGTCRGNPIVTRNLLLQVHRGARLMEKGVSLVSRKPVELQKE